MTPSSVSDRLPLLGKDSSDNQLMVSDGNSMSDNWLDRITSTTPNGAPPTVIGNVVERVRKLHTATDDREDMVQSGGSAVRTAKWQSCSRSLNRRGMFLRPDDANLALPPRCVFDS